MGLICHYAMSSSTKIFKTKVLSILPQLGILLTSWPTNTPVGASLGSCKGIHMDKVTPTMLVES